MVFTLPVVVVTTTVKDIEPLPLIRKGRSDKELKLAYQRYVWDNFEEFLPMKSIFIETAKAA